MQKLHLRALKKPFQVENFFQINNIVFPSKKSKYFFRENKFSVFNFLLLLPYKMLQIS